MKKYLILALLCMGSALFAQDDTDKTAGKSIHIDFQSAEGDGTNFKANLPLSLIGTVQPQIQAALTQVQQEKNIDLKQIWDAIKEAGPTEFMEIKSNENTVRVTSTKKLLKIYLEEMRDGDEYTITVPLALGDALFSGETLNLERLVDALLSLEGRDIVKIDSFHLQGRAWIE